MRVKQYNEKDKNHALIVKKIKDKIDASIA